MGFVSGRLVVRRRLLRRPMAVEIEQEGERNLTTETAIDHILGEEGVLV